MESWGRNMWVAGRSRVPAKIPLTDARPSPKGEKKQLRHPEKTLGQPRSLRSLGEGLLSPPTPKRRSTYCRMNWMASSYFIPLSIKASATRTGALKGNSSGGHSPAVWPRG